MYIITLCQCFEMILLKLKFIYRFLLFFVFNVINLAQKILIKSLLSSSIVIILVEGLTYGF